MREHMLARGIRLGSAGNGERRAEPPVGKVVGAPLSELSPFQRREFQEALLEAQSFEDLPRKWQAAIVKSEESRPELRLIRSDD